MCWPMFGELIAIRDDKTRAGKTDTRIVCCNQFEVPAVYAGPSKDGMNSTNLNHDIFDIFAHMLQVQLRVVEYFSFKYDLRKDFTNLFEEKYSVLQYLCCLLVRRTNNSSEHHSLASEEKLVIVFPTEVSPSAVFGGPVTSASSNFVLPHSEFQNNHYLFLCSSSACVRHS